MAACLHPRPTSREAARGHIISYPKRPLLFRHFLTPDLWWLPISHRIHNIEFTSSSEHSRTPITLSWLCSPVYLRFLKLTFLLWTIDRDFSIAEILPMRFLFLEPCHIIPQTCLFWSHMIIHLLNQYLLRANYGANWIPVKKANLCPWGVSHPLERQTGKGKETMLQCDHFCNGATRQWPGSVLLGISRISSSRRQLGHLMEEILSLFWTPRAWFSTLWYKDSCGVLFNHTVSKGPFPGILFQ